MPATGGRRSCVAPRRSSMPSTATSARPRSTSRTMAQRAALRRFILRSRPTSSLQNLRPGLVESYRLDAATLRAARAVADLLQSRGLRRRRPAQEPARLRSADAGLRRPDEPHRRGRPRARAHRPVDHRPGQRHVGGDRHPVRRCTGATATGQGCEVGTSLYETALSWTNMHAANYLGSRPRAAPHGIGEFRHLSRTRPIEARDGWVVVAAGNDNLFQRLADALGHPEWPADPRFRDQSRPRHQPRRAESAGRRGDRQDRHRRGLGREARPPPACPARRCSISSRSMAHPQFAAVGMLQDGPDGTMPLIGTPLQFDGERPPYRAHPPALGAHTNAVLGPRGDDGAADSVSTSPRLRGEVASALALAGEGTLRALSSSRFPLTPTLSPAQARPRASSTR